MPNTGWAKPLRRPRRGVRGVPSAMPSGWCASTGWVKRTTSRGKRMKCLAGPPMRLEIANEDGIVVFLMELKKSANECIQAVFSVVMLLAQTWETKPKIAPRIIATAVIAVA